MPTYIVNNVPFLCFREKKKYSLMKKRKYTYHM